MQGNRASKKAPLRGLDISTGAGEGIRTSDLLITSQLLYQLSYTGLHPYSKRKYYTLYSWLVKLPPRRRPSSQSISIWHIFIV